MRDFAELRPEEKKAVLHDLETGKRIVQGGVIRLVQSVYSRTEPRRNAPCPCKSGKKYKLCCGKIE